MGKITVIGAGNGGVTAAYHLTKNGMRVCLFDFPEFSSQIKAINENGGIEALNEDHGCSMILPGFERLEKATTDIREAMTFSEILIMICPSFAQVLFFKEMIPYLKDGQVIILMPGNYGSLVLNKMKMESDKADVDVTFVDAISIPWACRISKPGVITIMGLKEFLPVSIYPNRNTTDEIKQIVSDVTPIKVEFLANPVIAGLENINFGGHPLLTTLNMGILENFNGNFNYYKDCCSPAIANAAAKMDQERLYVGRCFGFELRTELEAMNALYDSTFTTVYDFNRASSTHGKINSAPNNSKHRYIMEDVPYLLVPCFEFAKVCGLKVPIVESCIQIASAYNDIDYFKTGITLEKMGLGGMSKEEIIQFLSK